MLGFDAVLVNIEVPVDLPTVELLLVVTRDADDLTLDVDALDTPPDLPPPPALPPPPPPAAYTGSTAVKSIEQRAAISNPCFIKLFKLALF